MKKTAKYQEATFLSMVVLFWFAQYVYIPYQTMFLAACGVTSSFAGIIVGAYGISQLILRLPVGLLADTAGLHKPFILLGCLASGAASLLRIFTPGGTGFLIANLFSGLASSMWISFMVFYTEGYPKEEQQAATSRIILFNNAGILLGFIASTVLYDRTGMQFICILSLLAGIIACLLGLSLQEEKEVIKHIPLKQLLGVCTKKRIWMFSLIALIQQGIQLTTTMSFTSQILKDLGATGAIVGMASIVYMISAVSFSGFASSKFCTKIGPKFWIPAVLLIVAVYCILVPRVNSIPLIFLLQILPGMSTGILFSYVTSEAMIDIPVQNKSTAMGFYQAFYALGMTFFPIFTGEAAVRYSMKTGYLILAVIAVLGGVAVSIFYACQSKKG
ncbi:MFS transporter [Anaerocolumna cellulosilytica]|uniref:MFS transporter n=1 Tax=Anaerocolumna cellulosilytica TaxID=433286 RepID=A0A6S6RB33_9FIRM|nr:MFS transporter [Anaerocolumna cellulosilytica]MBB5195227.1 MFS family permease [Anaerocolumna cellulosilytica]BCJ96700.1 MFS transporter [Anaerocolumna cellulosilytica]